MQHIVMAIRQRRGDALGNVNAEYLDDESKKIYDAVNSEVNSEYLASTYQDAYQKYSSLNYAEAAASPEDHRYG